MKQNYHYWDISYNFWNNIPEIPHCEKFIHSYGIALPIVNEKMRIISVLEKFSNDK